VIAGLETRELVEFHGLRESGTPGESRGGGTRRRTQSAAQVMPFASNSIRRRWLTGLLTNRFERARECLTSNTANTPFAVRPADNRWLRASLWFLWLHTAILHFNGLLRSDGGRICAGWKWKGAGPSTRPPIPQIAGILFSSKLATNIPAKSVIHPDSWFKGDVGYYVLYRYSKLLDIHFASWFKGNMCYQIWFPKLSICFAN